MQYAVIDKPKTLKGFGMGIYLCYCKEFMTLDSYTNEDDFCHSYAYSTVVARV